jgi:hypothetical protein
MFRHQTLTRRKKRRYQQMKDRISPPSAKSPQEVRAVRNENRIRKIMGLPLRITYNGVKIKF